LSKWAGTVSDPKSHDRHRHPRRQLYPEPAARAGHLGALQQRHDTTSTVLSASLRDALTGFLPRIARITRMQKENS
jgi:hypothetical protein